MSIAPILVRTFLKSAGADADFVGSQVSPGAAILYPVGSLQTVTVSFVPYTAAGAVSTGTLDIQMVYVNTPTPSNGTALPNLITGLAAVTGLGIGIESGPYTVTGNASLCIRVAGVGGLAGAVTTCKIFIRPVT